MSDQFIEIVERWSVVDKWWTDEPERRHFAAVAMTDEPGYAPGVCICFDERTQEWSLIEQPKEEVKIHDRDH